jgi:hypothetical protein
VILLDTNVLSALIERKPPPAVIAWLIRQLVSSAWAASITIVEIEYGSQQLPAGRRRTCLEVPLQGGGGAAALTGLRGASSGFKRGRTVCERPIAGLREHANRPWGPSRAIFHPLNGYVWSRPFGC